MPNHITVCALAIYILGTLITIVQKKGMFLTDE